MQKGIQVDGIRILEGMTLHTATLEYTKSHIDNWIETHENDGVVDIELIINSNCLGWWLWTGEGQVVMYIEICLHKIRWTGLVSTMGIILLD